jgi:rod shape-determining protein MreD
MSRGIYSEHERFALIWGARIAPTISTMIASMFAWAPFVTDMPIMPPFGLMVFLCWRFLHPTMWPIWVGLPLGLFDDLVSGHVIGAGMLSWTLMLMLFDWLEGRIVWRDWMFGWSIGVTTVTVYLIGAWMLTPIHPSIITLLPQILLAILLYPLVMHVCAALDNRRFRI